MTYVSGEIILMNLHCLPINEYIDFTYNNLMSKKVYIYMRNIE